jgi:hypothetical protein
MRILLVKPQAHLRTVLGLQRFQCLEPLEFGYLAAAIPEQHEVRVLDLRLYRFADAAFERANWPVFDPSWWVSPPTATNRGP